MLKRAPEIGAGVVSVTISAGQKLVVGLVLVRVLCIVAAPPAAGAGIHISSESLSSG